ncbi:MAG: NAD(P)-dependent oxidoreductase [Solobacterium sp.]|nr:NAD(P)-dependent oxidoreductase [Solobacterium sp.]
MKKVLITGAAGYIGSTLVYRLLNEGYEVVGVDILKFGASAIEGAMLNPKFKLIQSDIYDVENYENEMDENTAVVSLAAVVGEPACKKFEAEARRTNYEGCERLIRAAKDRHVGKLVFATTCSNYGQVPDGMMVDEEGELHPLGLYAQSKVDIEKYLINTVGNDLNWTILRFATVYGIGPRMRFDLTVNEFAAVGTTKKELEVFLPHSVRPYTHVIDIARAIQTVLDQKDKSRGQIYNVGDSRENYEKQEIVNEVKKLIPDLKVEYVERGTDLRSYRVNFDKIKRDLGFEVTRRVPDGVREVYEAILSGRINNLDNPNYYNI